MPAPQPAARRNSSRRAGRTRRPQAGQGAAVGNILQQAFADPLQQGIADVVPEALVDVLEMIQVDQQHGAAQPFALAAFQCMGDPFGEQQAVGQVAQRVVVGQVVQLMLRALQCTDVGEHRHVVTEAPLFVMDDADALPLRIDLAALAPVPHFAAPGPAIFQRVPHALVEAGVVVPRVEQIGALPEYLLAAVAGDATEGRIDMDDALVRVGDQHTFLSGIEHGSSLAQAVLVGTLLGDIAGNADKALWLAILVAQQTPARVDPAVAAVGMPEAVDVFVLLIGPLDTECLHRTFTVIRVQARGPVVTGIAKSLWRQAEQRGVAIGEEYPALGHVPVPQAVVGGIEGQAQAFLVARQLQPCAAMPLGVAVQHQVEQGAGQQDEEQSLE